MSFATINRTHIYWDECGSGPPLLLIMGLGYSSLMWHRSRAVLSSRFRTIAFDNRGVGRSEVPVGPYSISLMASDAAAVLDAAGVEDSHVFGVSMGGMIAQELAMTYPRRVRSLVLGCTASGWPFAAPVDPEALKVVMAHNMNPEEAATAIRPFIYDLGTPHERIAEDNRVLSRSYLAPEGFAAQLHGIMGWQATARISTIIAPTLVLHGESDRLIPTLNGRLIADRISSARFALLPKASHIFATDQPELTHQLLLDFLQAPS
jgi:3-oxoadipate enol-lactonase